MDDEAEFQDLSGEGGVRSDRSKEEDEDKEAYEDDDAEEEGDEDASDEEEDDDGEDVENSDASEGDDGEGGNEGDGGSSNSTSDSKGSSGRTPTKDDPKDGGQDHTDRKGADLEVDNPAKSIPQGRGKRAINKATNQLVQAVRKTPTHTENSGSNHALYSNGTYPTETNIYQHNCRRGKPYSPKNSFFVGTHVYA